MPPELRGPSSKLKSAVETLPNARALDLAPLCVHLEVVEVNSEPGIRRQLALLGIAAGAVLYVRRAAPLSGPILVEVNGSAIAIGRKLAHGIRVRVK